MNLIEVLIAFVDGREDQFVATDAYFADGFFHARDASDGALYSWPTIGIVFVRSKGQPQQVIARAPQVTQRSLSPRSVRYTIPPEESLEDKEEELPPIPSGARRITDPNILRAAVHIPPPAPNLSGLVSGEVDNVEPSSVGAIRKAARMRRMSSQGNG